MNDQPNLDTSAAGVPIRLVLGFSAGSASDQIAQALAPELSRQLGRTIEIELRPGSNGAAGACEVATALPDGNTLYMATLGTHALAPHLEAPLPYDPLQHFSAVSLVAIAPLVLACHESLKVSNARELIELARKHPGEITYGTSAIAGAPHLAAELFQSIAGIEMRHVRYERTERLYEELEAGIISISFNNIMSMMPRCKGGTLRALAVTSVGRSAVAPDVPTLIESGLPGYDVTNWLGLVAPAGTAFDVVDELAKALARAVKTPALEQHFLSAGVSPCATTPAQFTDFMTAELQRWSSVVEDFRHRQEDLSHTIASPGADTKGA
jgi:tripartite-type tricarboxylate transporter receptor subunit TctC